MKKMGTVLLVLGFLGVLLVLGTDNDGAETVEDQMTWWLFLIGLGIVLRVFGGAPSKPTLAERDDSIWVNDDYAAEVGGGICPLCGAGGCMLKVQFSDGPPRSLDRPPTMIYTNCANCRECPGGTNVFIIGPESKMSRGAARSFLNQIGNDLAREMATRI